MCVYVCIRVYREVHKFPRNLAAPQNSGCQKGNKNQVPCRGPTNISQHHAKFSQHCDLMSRIWALCACMHPHACMHIYIYVCVCVCIYIYSPECYIPTDVYYYSTMSALCLVFLQNRFWSLKEHHDSACRNETFSEHNCKYCILFFMCLNFITSMFTISNERTVSKKQGGICGHAVLHLHCALQTASGRIHCPLFLSVTAWYCRLQTLLYMLIHIHNVPWNFILI